MDLFSSSSGRAAMMREIEIALTEPQEAFVFSDQPFPAFVGGFGAGKSEALVTRLLMQKLRYPRLDVGYFAPTYDLVRLIGFARFEEKLAQWRIPYKLNKSDRQLYLGTGGSIIFRTLEHPDRIIGFEIADAGIDELDTLKTEHANNAWNKVIARCRQNKPDRKLNTCAVATTPEGFRFAYERWEKQRVAGYELHRAPTYSNPYLSQAYIDSLRATYPANLLAAYLEGRFVNLTSGAVYPDFDRSQNHTYAAIAPGEELHIGVDFNVYNCNAVVSVIRQGQPLTLNELTGMRDTPAMVRTIQEKFAGHAIHIYPDASGKSRRTVNASLSDLQILKEAGFNVHAKDANPLVRERIVAVQTVICDGGGLRYWKINTHLCPTLTECLEQQVFDKNGEPDKDGGKDHLPDAAGYFIYWHWPVAKPAVTRRIDLRFMAR
jgi:hypothetical protein